MKAAKITVIAVLVLAFIAWVKGNARFDHIVQVIPFLGGHRPGIYDLAGIVMILITIWGLCRLRSTRSGADEPWSVEDEDWPEDDWEEEEQGDWEEEEDDEDDEDDED